MAESFVGTDSEGNTAVFAHASERVAAEILDFYHIRWVYEPVSFPLDWDSNGRVVSYFTPDFYLVDFGVFIELTTMSQKLVTKKNRKARRLRQLYPDIDVKIFYQKDFRRLLARFGVPTESQPHGSGGGFTVPESDSEGSDGDVSAS